MEHLLDPAVLEALRTVSLAAFAVVFGAGLLMGVAPSSFALYPVVGGHVPAAAPAREAADSFRTWRARSAPAQSSVP